MSLNIVSSAFHEHCANIHMTCQQRSLYEAVSRLVEAVKDREESVDMREGQWKKSALSDADKQGLIDDVTCGLLKALDARARYRAQTPSSTPATRRKRSTGWRYPSIPS